MKHFSNKFPFPRIFYRERGFIMSEERVNQNIILEGRRKITVSGVTDVESFDESSISLVTELGILLVRGEGIKIEKLCLDSGEIVATGDFYLAEYTADEPQKAGFIKRLFR